MEIKEKIKEKKRILFPEFDDERIVEAVERINREGIIEAIIVKEDFLKDEYIDRLVELRKEKGMTREKASMLLKDTMYIATMMLENNDGDGIVSGAKHPTAHTLRPALQIIRTNGGIASSCFLMEKDKPLIFADCALNINPDEKELAEIAAQSAKTAEFFGIKPIVAMLSFSTKGSARHEMADKVINATKIAKEKYPYLAIDGELQFDAAFVESVGKRKAPDSEVAGKANVFIFPNLDAGNIGYKIAQRMGNYKAIGPIVQGLRKPVNDLSRGCSVEDIIELAYITALQAQ